MKNRQGFTLIELLVVVAIIAILAAIAVPNFLNAQTRSKASRAQADLRTVVTALETYRIDNNRYPTHHYSAVTGSTREFHVGGQVPAFAVPDPNWDGRNPLTSPIAYMTSMPEDPFMTHKNGPKEVREYLYVNWSYALVSNPPATLVGAFQTAQQKYGSYRLHSRGPDRQGPDSGIPYDPTNGVVSVGDITYGPNSGFNGVVDF